jgi:hypothetical protein
MFTAGLKRFACLAVCGLALALAGNARAADDDMPEPGAKGDSAKLNTALRDVINRGADLYNSGDRNGCYRLFEGALLAVKAQMAGNSEVVKVIDAGIASANQEGSPGLKAFALRKALVDVRTTLGGGKVAVAPTKSANRSETDWPRSAARRSSAAAVSASISSIRIFAFIR